MKARFINESAVGFELLVKELEKRKVPCRVKQTNFGLDIECGWNYPDSIANKAFNAIEAAGVNADVCAESSGGVIIKSAIVAGGPRRY